ncbi:AAA ATPase domain [Fusarium oxysporum f. sp. vasinfectum]|nr:AAA ATPase domain [Fusarium oxysporum f. sp. vasinfectum]
MPPPNCLLHVEDTFGPVVKGCGSNFDFTLLFEETILCILPLCVAICLAVFRITRLWTKPVIFKGCFILPLKLIAWTLVLGSQTSTVALFSIRDETRTRASIAAGSIGILGSAILACLSFLEHQRAVRTSSILVLYLLSTIPMDAARARTLWRMLDGRDPAIAVMVLASTKVCALVTEMLWKCSLVNRHELCDAPEESNGIVERALMLRMMPIFWAGYRTPLQTEHLSKLDTKLQNAQLRPTEKGMFPRSTIKEEPSADQACKRDLLLSHYRVSGTHIPRLCYLALTFAQPFLVRRAIDYISKPKTDGSKERGDGLIAAYALVYYGIAFVSSLYEQSAVRATTVVRADLSMRIYQQSLLLDRVVDTGDSSTTMMTADVERVQLGVRKIHDAWASFVSVAIGLWLIEAQLGLAALVTLGLIGGSLLLGGYWSGRASRFQKNWMAAIEKRLHKTVQVLKGIKSIKQMGAAPAIKTMLENERQSEIKLSKRFRLQLIALVTLSFTSLTMLPALGLSVHNAVADKSSGRILTAQTAFQVMTLFNIVSSSIQDCTSHVMAIMVGLGSLQRIESFLNQHTWTDPRKSIRDASISTDESSVGGTSEKKVLTDVAVKIQNVSAKWTEDGEAVIKDATFDVPAHGLTVIAGPTGSGKSTLLRVVLGDLAPSSGTVSVDDSQVAFCDQTPWIANISIKENIVGALPFYEERYRMALHACALDQDIEDLTDGDKHLCGLNGQSVSGGQKVRIALARGIYSKATLVLLDDCLVGLDTNTERHILGEIFAPRGLLSSAPTTTILATSSPRYIPFANYIILIDADGRVVRQGTYAEIAPHIEQLEHDVLQVSDRASTAREPRAQDSDELPNTAITNDIAFKKGANGDWAVYKWYFGVIGWMDFIVFLFLCLLFVIGVIFPQIWLGLWTEKSLQDQIDTLPSFYGVFFGVGSMAWVALFSACVWLFLRIAVRTAALFHHLILTTTLNARMDFFSQTDSGVTLNRFSQDLQITDMELPLAFVGATMNLLMLIAQCIVVTIQSHYAGFAILAIAVVIGFFHEFYLRTSRRLRVMDIEARSPVLSLLLESLDGLATVRAYGWAAWYLRRGIEVLERSQVPFHFLQSAQVTLNLSVDLFVATLALVVISIAVVQMNTSGGSLGLALFNIVGLGQSVKGVVFFWTSLEITLGAVARIRDFTQDTHSEHESDTKPPAEWPSRGRDSFQRCYAHSFNLVATNYLESYTGYQARFQDGYLRPDGKSTLVNSLLGLVQVSSGIISIDDVDISTLAKDEVRSRFVVLPQESLILSVSIREYAKLFGISDEQEIIQGLEKTGLWQTIEQGGGLDMIASSDTFSHGERQLFAMTLACLKKGKIVLMDEPTSHVDNDIQTQLRQTVFDTFPDSTVLCVTHQVATIVEFDIVLVLDDGKIVEQGDPKELLRQPTSRFAQLYSAGEL